MTDGIPRLLTLAALAKALAVSPHTIRSWPVGRQKTLSHDELLFGSHVSSFTQVNPA
jgi:hypothetical protein